LPEARADLQTVSARLAAAYPATNRNVGVQLKPLREELVGTLRPAMLSLLGAVLLVLLIACANVANLLMVRATAQRREIAVRQALGAQNQRLIRQLLTESLLLFLLGGIAGFAILFSTKSLLLHLVPDSLPTLNDIAVSWNDLAFAVAISVVAGTTFGLAPAWLTSRTDLIETLKQDGRGSKGSKGRSRARQILVIGELALSLVLMVAAGLLLRSFWDLYKVEPGFNTDRVMALQTWLPGPNDPSADKYRSATQEAPLVREILRRGRTLPGVEQVALGDTSALPLGHDRTALNPMPLVHEGSLLTDTQAPRIDGSTVSPEYFNLLGMSLLRGRLFNDQDVEGTPDVAVVNRAAARTFWPNEDPVGKRVRLRTGNLGNRELLKNNSVWTTIIGVIADARTESLADAVVPQLYRTVYQHASKDLTIYLRGQLDPRAITVQVREQVQAVDPEIPVFHPETLDDVLSTSLSVRRFSMEMVALFAVTALLLAGLGIYGTISYVVSEQRREIAIRLALGAERGDILKMVMRRGLGLAAAGAALGVAGALAVSHLMAGLLYGVSPNDLTTFVGVTFLLTTVALAASYIPALRSMRLDPNTVLHSE
jgi:putative ABC transport system permease protein